MGIKYLHVLWPLWSNISNTYGSPARSPLSTQGRSGEPHPAPVGERRGSGRGKAGVTEKAPGLGTFYSWEVWGPLWLVTTRPRHSLSPHNSVHHDRLSLCSYLEFQN